MNQASTQQPDHDAQQLRFVVLLHEMPLNLGRETHWDLMLEKPKGSAGANVGLESAQNPEGLATWALESDPTEERTHKDGIRCLRLQDHRTRYLDYEGPVSNNRGSVQKWATGKYRCHQWHQDEIKIELCSSKVNGVFTLTLEQRHAGDSEENNRPCEQNVTWRFRRLSG